MNADGANAADAAVDDGDLTDTEEELLTLPSAVALLSPLTAAELPSTVEADAATSTAKPPPWSGRRRRPPPESSPVVLEGLLDPQHALWTIGTKKLWKTRKREAEAPPQTPSQKLLKKHPPAVVTIALKAHLLQRLGRSLDGDDLITAFTPLWESQPPSVLYPPFNRRCAVLRELATELQVEQLGLAMGLKDG